MLRQEPAPAPTPGEPTPVPTPVPTPIPVLRPFIKVAEGGVFDVDQIIASIDNFFIEGDDGFVDLTLRFIPFGITTTIRDGLEFAGVVGVLVLTLPGNVVRVFFTKTNPVAAILAIIVALTILLLVTIAVFKFVPGAILPGAVGLGLGLGLVILAFAFFATGGQIPGRKRKKSG